MRAKKTVNKNTHIVKDFDIDGDDISFFIKALEKHFSVKPALEEWGEWPGFMKLLM